MTTKKYLYISCRTRENVLHFTIIKSFYTISELRSFIDIITLVINPLHTLDNSDSSMIFYNFDANSFIDTLIADNKALVNWYTLRNLDRSIQVHYSIYTEEQFKRTQIHLTSLEREFIVKIV